MPSTTHNLSVLSVAGAFGWVLTSNWIETSKLVSFSLFFLCVCVFFFLQYFFKISDELPLDFVLDLWFYCVVFDSEGHQLKFRSLLEELRAHCSLVWFHEFGWGGPARSRVPSSYSHVPWLIPPSGLFSFAFQAQRPPIKMRESLTPPYQGFRTYSNGFLLPPPLDSP